MGDFMSGHRIEGLKNSLFLEVDQAAIKLRHPLSPLIPIIECIWRGAIARARYRTGGRDHMAAWVFMTSPLADRARRTRTLAASSIGKDLQVMLVAHFLLGVM